MRLFLGIELDERVRAAAVRAADDLREALQASAPGLVARWIPPANLHLTVWFIGEVPEATAEDLISALRRTPLAIPAFGLGLAGCGAFPPAGAPRVLWIGVRSGGESLAALHREVAVRLEPLGFRPERRAFSAHLTLARVKDAGRLPPRTLRGAISAAPCKCGTMPVTALTLFRSRLSPRGASYEPLLRVPLQVDG